MFNGWMSFAGNEVINSARTEAYLATAKVTWFTPTLDSEGLGISLGDEPYLNPVDDDAPWLDVDDPSTREFWGYYPLDMSGTNDSTRQSTTVQSIGNGGVSTPLRFGTRDIVFTGIVFANDDCSLEAGISWLRYTLIDSPCADGSEGVDMCLLSCSPPLCDDCPPECVDDYIRTFRNVVVTNGPKVLAEYNLSDGTKAAQVEFTATCGVPWSYSTPLEVTWVTDVWPTPTQVTGEPVCTALNTPVTDPSCPPLPPAPSVPDIALTCFTLPPVWDRYPLLVPAGDVRRWQDTVLNVALTTDVALRNVRLRFHPDPFSRGLEADVDPCGYCGEFFVTYVPPNSTLTLDGSNETITVTTVTGLGLEMVQDASTLVQATDGGPFDWPVLTCGYAYVMHFDVPHNSPLPSGLTLSLVNRGV